MVSDQQRRLLALCAIRVDNRSPDWNVLARQAAEPGGLDRLYQVRLDETSKDAQATADVLRIGLEALGEAEARVERELEAAAGVGAYLSTVMDEDYPTNLSLIYNLPPFVFRRGAMVDADIRSVAVVGTRDATELGIRQAAKMAQLLSDRGVTVVSGLAKGIDTAAHGAALDCGGRTLAVLGTGITKAYPAANKALQERIATGGQGAVISQFWPTAGGATWTFPRRNVVTSGISQGTVVIQASSTSGAKMQARIALEHGKRLWLIRSLVEEQQWARTYVQSRGAEAVEDVEDVIRDLVDPGRVRRAAQQTQLELAL
jgi:DNA processing protein